MFGVVSHPLFEDTRVFIGSRSELAKFDWLSRFALDQSINKYHRSDNKMKRVSVFELAVLEERKCVSVHVHFAIQRSPEPALELGKQLPLSTSVSPQYLGHL